MKLLVAGDVDGKLDKLFSRVAAIHQKSGPFDALFCVGRFFSGSSKTGCEGEEALKYLQGTLPVPLPTYFIVANNSEVDLAEEGCELCPNLKYLGKGGITSIGDLHVAFVSGCYDKYVQQAGASTNTAYTSRSIKDIVSKASSAEFGRMIDVLLTSEWPKNVLSTLPEPVVFPGGSLQISQMVKALEPRYHFAGTEDMFLQRLPYKNEEAPYPTRFLGLAKLSDSTEKHKRWLYAFNLTPAKTLGLANLKSMSCEEATENPFLASNIEKKEAETQALLKRQREEAEGTTGDGAKRQRPAEDFECWFCIDKVKPDARHLVVSHGNFTYLSLAKGGLMDYHMLILPMEHFTAYNTVHAEVEDEIHAYLDGLKAFFETKGQYLVYYERNIYKFKPQHMIIQVFPIENRFSPTIVRDVLLGKAVDAGLAFDTYEEGDRLSEQYFLFCLPNEKMIYKHHPKKGPQKFDIKFGRDAIAQVLGRPKAADWRACTLSVEQEKSLAESFKKEFKPFDWTLKKQNMTGGSAGP